MRSVALVALVALLTLIAPAACTLTAPPVEHVLTAPTANSITLGDDPALPLVERGVRLQRLLDDESTECLCAARAKPDDVAVAVAAAASLFRSAELRMQRATLAALLTQPAKTWHAVDSADELIQNEDRVAILGLSTAGKEFADHALERAPEDPGALLHCALHLSLIAWANGPTRSLMAGYGGKLERSIAAVVAKAPDFDHGAPLRLQGRFLSEAPWPYGNAAKAKEALLRAVTLGPLPVTHLFLGDVLADAGDLEGARVQWQLATRAEDFASTRASGPFHRELARLRLATVQSDTK